MADDAGAKPEQAREVMGIVASWQRQRADPEGAGARASQWAEDNAEAIRAYNERIEREGCFGEEWRSW